MFSTTWGGKMSNGQLTSTGVDLSGGTEITPSSSLTFLNLTLTGILNAVSAAITSLTATTAQFTTLTVTGTSTQSTTNTGALTCTTLTASGNSTVGGTFGVTGTTTLGTANITTANVSGNAAVTGTLGVTNTTTLGTANITTANVSGNASVTGTLNVTGASTLGATNMGAATCTGMVNSGNSTVAGSLGVTGSITCLAVTGTGNSQFSGVTATTYVSTPSLTVDSISSAALNLDLIPSPGATYCVRIGNGQGNSLATVLRTKHTSTSSTLQTNGSAGTIVFEGGNTATSLSIQAGNLFAGNRVVCDSSVDAGAGPVGALQARSGGAYINKSIQIDGAGVTAATSTTTGAVRVTAGGAGIVGNVYVSGFVSIGATMPLLVARTQLGTTGVFYCKTAAGSVCIDGSNAVGTLTHTINGSNALPASCRPANDIPSVQVMGGPNGYAHMWARASTGFLEVTSTTAGTTIYINMVYYAA